MLKILRELVSWAGWLVLSFIAIVILLALFNELPAKLGGWRVQAENAARTAADLTEGKPAFRQAAHEALKRADDDIKQLKQANYVKLKEAQRDIEQRKETARMSILDAKGIALAAVKGESGKIVASYQAEYVEVPLLDRADGLIKLRLENLKIVSERKSLQSESDDLMNEASAIRQGLDERNQWQKRAAAQLRYPVCRQADWIPGCRLVRAIRTRDRELQDMAGELRTRVRDLRAKSAALKVVKFSRERVADGKAIMDQAIRAYEQQAQRQADSASGYVWNKAKAVLLRYGWQAFLILLGAVFLPPLHKWFAYRVIAPLAARAQPVRLSTPGPSLIAGMSGLSIEVPIRSDTELLLRSGLQSSATSIQGGYKCVLDWSIPFTCISAGLINLQCLRSDWPDHVCVTGQDDHHHVAAITVPAGGAVVLHPRALVGILKPRGKGVLIERPWRIWWLISWVTVQFRYIVFHGPCTLITQGRGGVNAEDAGRSRMIDKRLTLGFDAGLGYGAARSASFLPYLKGQASLFNDRYDGVGKYLYEVRATGAGNGSIWGRGLKGIGDAILNVFGI